jgi:hypothetical protein
MLVNFSTDISQVEFFLVASFGRCKLKLDSLSVGSLLQAAIGGINREFNVVPLSNRVFRFSVSCKQVGFFIHQLCSFHCEEFSVFFHLWNNGGPNWIKEFRDYIA